MTIVRYGLVPTFEIEGADDWGLALCLNLHLACGGGQSPPYMQVLSHREKRFCLSWSSHQAGWG